MENNNTTEKEVNRMSDEEPEKEIVNMSSYGISFGDLSNLEALIDDAQKQISLKGLNVEHFAEMRKIIKRVKNAKA